MKALLTITAILEAATGLALLAAPSALASTLLGAPLETAAAQAVARIAGVALLSLGVACWLARKDTKSRAARGIISGMLLYNIGVVAVLVYGATGVGSEGMSGPSLWPAAALHSALAVWCGACLFLHRESRVHPAAPEK